MTGGKMSSQARGKPPSVSGLLWHRDQYYSFFIPNNWHRLRWPDNREGVIYGPDPTDPFTVFAVDIKDLGVSITPADVDVLAEGFFESIQQLPACDIESREQKVSDTQIKLEAKYTFDEQGETRKRWACVFYHETRQIAMTAQGATPEQYDYWLPWFFEAMMTVRIHNEKPDSGFWH
jgi:hypothetical protein